jgi:hypothetical protein
MLAADWLVRGAEKAGGPVDDPLEIVRAEIAVLQGTNAVSH